MLGKTKFVPIWFQNKISLSIRWRLAEDKIQFKAITKMLLIISLIKFLIMIILLSQFKMISKIITKKIKI